MTTVYTPKLENFVTTAEITEAVALLRGEPILSFGLPSPTLIRDEDGNYHTTQSSAWVKLRVAFRDVMLSLKGAPLAVFLSICLHVNGDGAAWPGYDTICAETGYARAAVARAIKHLESIPGLLEVTRRDGTSNSYRPAYVAYGRADPLLKANSTPYQKRTTPPTKSELEVEPLSRTSKKSTGAEAAPASSHSKTKSKNTAAEKAPRQPDLLFDAVAEVCAGDTRLNGSTIGRVTAELRGAGYTPDDVRAFGKDWWAWDKRTKAPSVWKLKDGISQVRAQSPAGKPRQFLPEGI